MRNAILCFLLTCAAVFGQSASDNAANDALRKRILGMNLINPPGRIVLAGPLSGFLAGPPAPPKVCAIPLLRVIPPVTVDKMPVMKPQGKALAGDTVQVPAPACDEAR
jgi:hypothetical protein